VSSGYPLVMHMWSKKRTKRRRLLLGGVVAVVLFGCAEDPDDAPSAETSASTVPNRVANKITGSVGEWFVRVDAQRAEAGEVVFAIANFGVMYHEFLVARTDYEPGEIPLGENNRFDEEDKGIEVVDEIAEWPANEAKVLKVELEAGTYELLCNIAGHYANGMHTTFIVEE
jgi:uncharacterized cupredoxin-like copper-binding protein